MVVEVVAGVLLHTLTLLKTSTYSMIDLTLHQEFKKGSVAVRNPGMPHGPWRVPAGGCRLFEIRSKNPL